MYDTGGSYSVCRLDVPDDNLARRLNWLSFELSPDTERRRLVFEREERRTLSMLRPTTTEEAYRRFGTFLGLLPPFALFERIFTGVDHKKMWWVALFVTMNLVCCLVGRWFGAFLGRWAGDPRARSRVGFAFVIFVMAVAWSVVTGGLGGLPFFGLGAIAGVFFAVPVAFAAFPIFAVLHRLLSHGGMIEGRQVWPLAFGVPLMIAALILSPWFK